MKINLRSSHKRSKLKVWEIVVGGGIATTIVFPIYWMIITGLRPQTETFSSTPKLIPTITLDHYKEVLEEGTVLQGLWNSIVVATSSTLLALILGVPAAYVLARWEFKRKSDLWFWIISNRFISPIVVVLPFFLIAINLQLVDTYWVMIIIYQTFAIPFVVWLSIDQFRAIPKEIDEAAAVDGASIIKTFLKIDLPLVFPSLSVSAVLIFVSCWNELLFAQILTRSDAITGPVVALGYMSGYDIRWGPMMATSTLVVLPIILFTAALSRNLVRGLAMGAIK
jgi:multiple sugar transport system permease protein